MRSTFLSKAGLIAVITAAVLFAGTSSAGEMQRVIVHADKPYGPVIADIESIGGNVRIQYRNADAVAATVPIDEIATLNGFDSVNGVEKDRIVQLPTPQEDAMSAERLGDLGDYELHNLQGPGTPGSQQPAIYESYLSGATNAELAWGDSGAGSESLIAVIDTGIWENHPCLTGRVVEGPDFSPDQGTAFEGSTLPSNNFHGTFVAGESAANCSIALPLGSAVADAIQAHVPQGGWFESGGQLVVPLFGTAPLADLLAVKVFPHTGAGVPTSIIEQGLDHVITQHQNGTVDVDVINMSLGGASLADGLTLEEQLVDEAVDSGIVVAVAAGNEGPAPVSVGSPGTAFSALTVAAASDAPHSRVFWDLLFGPGQGQIMFPTDELRVHSFSSRGPLADGRRGVDVTATGVFNFSLFTPSDPGALGLFGWSSGTSFSTPQVAGAAAVLNSYAELNDADVSASQIRNAIVEGAEPFPDFSEEAQGGGFLKVDQALSALQDGVNGSIPQQRSRQLRPNILKGNNSSVTKSVTLGPGRAEDLVLEITDETEEVRIDIDVDNGPIPPGPGAIGNSFEVYVKSAKRGSAPYIVNSANLIDDGSVVVRDGSTTLSGGFVTGDPAQWPMEPGLMKVTLESDWTNSASSLSADVTITRTDGAPQSNAGGVTQTIAQDEFGVFPVTIPAGTSKATFDLSWKKDWSKFPTNDVDLLFVSPSSFPGIDFNFLDAATLNSPERQVIENPTAGQWLVLVNGFSVHRGRDPYELDVTLE